MRWEYIWRVLSFSEISREREEMRRSREFKSEVSDKTERRNSESSSRPKEGWKGGREGKGKEENRMKEEEEEY